LGAQDERMGAQRLEGSRFGVCLATHTSFASSLVAPKRVKTGGPPENGPSVRSSMARV
jgi:hypothetical protein